MNAIDRETSALILAILESPEYKEYHKQEAELKKDPQLKSRVDQFRKDNFYTQTKSGDMSDWLHRTEEMERESAELRRIPQVNLYMDAELALCRLLQRTVSRVTAGVAMDIPI